MKSELKTKNEIKDKTFNYVKFDHILTNSVKELGKNKETFKKYPYSKLVISNKFFYLLNEIGRRRKEEVLEIKSSLTFENQDENKKIIRNKLRKHDGISIGSIVFTYLWILYDLFIWKNSLKSKFFISYLDEKITDRAFVLTRIRDLFIGEKVKSTINGKNLGMDYRSLDNIVKVFNSQIIGERTLLGEIRKIRNKTINNKNYKGNFYIIDLENYLNSLRSEWVVLNEKFIKDKNTDQEIRFYDLPEISVTHFKNLLEYYRGKRNKRFLLPIFLSMLAIGRDYKLEKGRYYLFGRNFSTKKGIPIENLFPFDFEGIDNPKKLAKTFERYVNSKNSVPIRISIREDKIDGKIYIKPYYKFVIESPVCAEELENL